MELTAKNKSFSKKEWQLFQYVLNQQAEVCSMSIRELADTTKTSSTTVLRFCRKFDCEGFSEFKIKLKKTLQKQGKTDRLFKQDKKALH
ncbi:MurR/RpiR family transcriptional regulator, partial [Enterococcus casseliflavus]|nr:MurR/RpiR family transcriptional regulator [Enterococcus casseliflavus]